MMTFIEEIAFERARQINEEGWSADHDDTHSNCEMATAAACYAIAPSMVQIEREWVPPDRPQNWPWHWSWWKPRTYRQNLVRAAALLVAEIERWDRLKYQNCPCGGFDCTNAPEGPMHNCPYPISSRDRARDVDSG